MPSIPEEHHRPTEDEVIIDLLKSIAMEETALANLMQAEAAKIWAFVGCKRDFPLNPSVAEIIAFNAGVVKLMDVIVMKEWLLLRKLAGVMELIPEICYDDGGHGWEE